MGVPRSTLTSATSVLPSGTPASIDPSLGLVNFGLGQILTILATESRLRTTLLEEKAAADDDKVNYGSIPAAVTKALKEGHYTHLTHFWNRAVAQKRASSWGSTVRVVNRDVKDFEWNDWITAMLKLSAAYTDVGQGNIGRQVLNLLQGALIASASWQRVSIQDACEAVRREGTHRECKWSADSLYTGEPHILLTALGYGKFSRRAEKKRAAPGISFNRYSIFEKDSDQRGGQFQLERGSPYFPIKKQFMGLCRYWARGQVCEHTPCRFSHSCKSCGAVQVHNPTSCPLMQVASKSQQRT
jgi:hypothetical protein